MGRWILRGVRRGAGERRDGRGVSRAAILALAAGSRPVRLARWAGMAAVEVRLDCPVRLGPGRRDVVW